MSTTSPVARDRVILCLDLDAFFASVEIADRPELADPRHPLAVGSPDPRRGVISTASYAARAFGVRSGMSTAEALRRCPTLTIVAPRHDRYADVSAQVFALCRTVTDLVEPTSIDEGYLDISAHRRDTTPAEIAAGLRRRIRAEIGIAASIGIGANKRVAKIACEQAKPDGVLEVPSHTERDFLAPLPIRSISGVGPKTEALLLGHGIQTCGQLASTPLDHLRRWFGPNGGWLQAAAAGIDDDPVEVHRARRSLSAEVTLEEDIAEPALLGTVATGLADELARRLRSEGCFARGLTLKLKDAGMRTITRAATIAGGTDDPAVLAAVAQQLIERTAKGAHYRLVGVAATHLVSGEQLTLFGRGWGETLRR